TLFGSEVDPAAAGFVAATANDATDIMPPDPLPIYLVGQVPGVANAAASPVYCPDGIHGSVDGPQKATATVPDQVFGLDLDGEARNPQSSDAGADVIATNCPGG